MIPSEYEKKPCVKRLNKSTTVPLCHGVGLQLIEGPNSELEVYCGNQSQSINQYEDCDTENEIISHHNHIYFFSTQVLKVRNIYYERICSLAIKEAIFSQGRTRLIHLTARICHRDGSNTTMSGLTHLTHHHQRINYPIQFNPAPVAEHHTKPYWISQVGLYQDNLSRLSIRISTSQELER